MVCGGHIGEWEVRKKEKLGLGKDEQSRVLIIRTETSVIGRWKMI